MTSSNQPNKRTIIIGDVHGCLHELHNLLHKVSYTPNDRLIFTGDLINKGPFSFETLEFVRLLNAETVMGNHEYYFLQYLLKNKRYFTKNNKKKYATLEQKIASHYTEWISWFNHIPFYIKTHSFMVVHAGLHPTLPIEKTPLPILLEIRTWDGLGKTLCRDKDPPWFEFYHDNTLVVFGHWARKGLVVRSNVIGLDSGCVYGRQLSALILPTKEIVQVQAHKNYLLK